MDEAWILMGSTLKTDVFSAFKTGFCDTCRKADSVSEKRELVKLAVIWIEGKMAKLRDSDLRED
jgi:hypothetical protein